MHRPPPVLPPEALRRVCDPSQFDFETPASLPPLTEVLGQPHAVQALAFGTNFASHAFNLFALGLPGSGKTTLIREYLERQASRQPLPPDLCYVYNFADYRHLLRHAQGFQWRRLPTNLPPRQTVYGYFWRWNRNGIWEQINAALVRQVLTQHGRKPQPSAAVIDSQSIKTSAGGEARGMDVHRQTAGRKRHMVVDTLGLLLIVLVHSASVQAAAGGQLVLQRLFERIMHGVHNRWRRLKLIWADAAYAASVATVRKQFGWQLDIVRRSAGTKGFAVLPHRRVVERTFGWPGRYRRLAGDDEHTGSSSEAMTNLASMRRLLKFVAE